MAVTISKLYNKFFNPATSPLEAVLIHNPIVNKVEEVAHNNLLVNKTIHAFNGIIEPLIRKAADISHMEPIIQRVQQWYANYETRNFLQSKLERMQLAMQDLQTYAKNLVQTYPRLAAGLISAIVFFQIAPLILNDFAPFRKMLLDLSFFVQQCALTACSLNLLYALFPNLKEKIDQQQNPFFFNLCRFSLWGTGYLFGGMKGVLQIVLFDLWRTHVPLSCSIGTCLLGHWHRKGFSIFSTLVGLGVLYPNIPLQLGQKGMELVNTSATTTKRMWRNPLKTSKDAISSLKEPLQKIKHALSTKNYGETLARISSIMIPLSLATLLIVFPPYSMGLTVPLAVLIGCLGTLVMLAKCDEKWKETSLAIATKKQLENEYREYVKNCQSNPMKKEEFFQNKDAPVRNDLYQQIKRLYRLQNMPPLEREDFERLVDEEEKRRNALLFNNPILENKIFCDIAREKFSSLEKKSDDEIIEFSNSPSSVSFSFSPLIEKVQSWIKMPLLNGAMHVLKSLTYKALIGK